MATIQYQKLCRACFHVIPGSVDGCTYCGAELTVVMAMVPTSTGSAGWTRVELIASGDT